jgi:hypothetical protein
MKSIHQRLKALHSFAINEDEAAAIAREADERERTKRDCHRVETSRRRSGEPHDEWVARLNLTRMGFASDSLARELNRYRATKALIKKSARPRRGPNVDSGRVINGRYIVNGEQFGRALETQT